MPTTLYSPGGGTTAHRVLTFPFEAQDDTGAHVRYAHAVAAREGWRTRAVLAVDEAHEACMSLQESWVLYGLCCFFQGALEPMAQQAPQ